MAISPGERNDVGIFSLWFATAMSERNFEDARRALASRAGFPKHETLAPDALFEGVVARAEGNMERATAAFLESRKASEALLRDHPTVVFYLLQAAEVDAALGRRQEALGEIEKALELENDPLNRPGVLISQAAVYCRLGDRESALPKLAELARMPNGIDYGSLRFDPEWDALRGDPRFQKIVTDLKPKD